jgi:hypothetical protein
VVAISAAAGPAFTCGASLEPPRAPFCPPGVLGRGTVPSTSPASVLSLARVSAWNLNLRTPSTSLRWVPEPLAHLRWLSVVTARARSPTPDHPRVASASREITAHST